jgi:hypothetical protein
METPLLQTKLYEGVIAAEPGYYNESLGFIESDSVNPFDPLLYLPAS